MLRVFNKIFMLICFRFIRLKAYLICDACKIYSCNFIYKITGKLFLFVIQSVDFSYMYLHYFLFDKYLKKIILRFMFD